MMDWIDHLRSNHYGRKLKKFKNSVRYQLLILTSAPILLGFLFLMLCALYLAFHYMKTNALEDISGRLAIVNQSLSLVEKRQKSEINGISESYLLLSMIQAKETESRINRRLKHHYQRLDYLHFSYLNQGMTLPKERSAFEIFPASTLQHLAPELVEKARIGPSDRGQTRLRSLVLNTVVTVRAPSGRPVGILTGGMLINHSLWLVDSIRNLLYFSPTTESWPQGGAVTIFMDNIRVATNVPMREPHANKRALGTLASSPVYQHVVIEGRRWVDFAKVLNHWHIAAYQPLVDAQSHIIGMIYTGYPLWPLLHNALVILIRFVLVCAGILLLSGWFVYHTSKSLLHPIEHLSHVAHDIEQGIPRRVGRLRLNPDHELARLGQQFDTMLDALEHNHQQLQHLADELENKVTLRTARLQEKQIQLEHHITLLNQTRSKLIAKEKLAALGELTAGIAHEMNNPVAVILGNTELIRWQIEAGNDDIDEELNTILAQIERVKLITRSLLQYSRNDDTDTALTWQQINPIVTESITLVKTGNYKRHIEFQVDLQAKQACCIHRHQLLQVLVNLELNACQAMGGQGVVRITTRDRMVNQRPESVAIEISDSGCGIRAEALNRIFTPFYTTKKEGTGLGLSVSQNLVHQMGGVIDVHSEPNQGSVFIILFPCLVPESINH